ncbi:hypothetical protein BCR41DRAFT_388191 [Lobosporangium transversale]|uniref:Maintenance of telomere capping protein 6 n=1 Tax=Lobosporangium transversale TaxID=64571 RepID=A0A1Y2GFT2_9FUNG|nr:hypothetical protein BCR41DRAFT_388191 [Lobosporangium transversale]ORZ09660.1 hypothetical protein BCR41DRAFT_388191 [Lobosporangium transversale]|eukprot:XP_021878930.1 hypothetical protein BCR41DRAFT_388191 [Lobosporangium transversale]
MTSLVPSHPHFPSYINISLPTTIHSETLPSEQVQAQGHAQTQTQQRIDPCFAITKYPLTNIDAPCISATFASLYRAIRIFAVFYSTPATSACSGSAQTVSPTLAFFLFLSINCLLSSLSSPSPLFPSSKQSLLPSLALYHPLMLFQPCEAVSYNVNSNQRSDVPSDDLPPLIGPDFAYTQHTPLGNLEHAREYADGALMTQKLIAAPIVPIDRQMWVGVDTRTAYFGNNFGGEKINQAIDGITCSTGEDLLMLLQGLQNWIEKTSENEYEDVVLIILNLNELASNTLGSQLPLRSPTPSSLLQPMPLPTSTDNSNTRKSTPVGNGTTVGLKNGTFFESVASLNTNRMIKALLPDRHSLHDLFTDAFPSLIYSPILLQKDREDLMSSWWKSGVVGLDYYNTTTDPLSGRIMTPTGWPTSAYLTEVIKRRIVVGIGSNNLSDNSTYNIMDDFTTLYAPGMLGPSMMNSSLLQVSTSLNLSTCDSPVPGVAMVPTGAETNSSVIKEPKEDGIKNGDNLKTMNVTWSFSSMSDSDLLPWSNTSIQLATTCGFSTLVKGRSPILTFSEQTAMTIWSWDINQPPPSQIRSRDRRCGAMQINGRWAAQDCNMKLPVACRRVNTSSVWIIYDQGAANYRDVTCPEGYAFDVPRTARENHQLYLTLLSYWNAAAPAFSINRSQRREHLKKAEGKYLTEKLLNNGNMPFNNKRHDQQYQDQDNYADDEEEGTDGSYPLPSTVSYARNGHGTSFLNREILNLTTSNALSRSGSTLPLSGGIPGAGMVWIDISSWQTAGCWVPGGIHGTCPYRPPDNTVALQEIIKVSTIGGVIVLVLMGMFLYLKCRRNVRLRKANKRRANVRNMIIRTEVETVPA